MTRAVFMCLLACIALDARADGPKPSSWRARFPKLSINYGLKAVGTGYVAVGSIETDPTHKTNKTDILVLRLDATGHELWRYQEGTKDAYDNGGGIGVAPDGGFLVVGDRAGDAVATRLDKHGKAKWKVTFDHANAGAYDAVAVAGGWVVGGTDGPGPTLWFVDDQGKLGWSHSGPRAGATLSVHARDGGVVAVGEINSDSGKDGFFWSVDLDGTERVFQRFVDPVLRQSATDLAPTKTGYVIAMNLYKDGTGSQGETVKLVEIDPVGKAVRDVPIAGGSRRFSAIAANPAGGFTLVGHRNLDQAWLLGVDDKLVTTRDDTIGKHYSAATHVIAAGGRMVVLGFTIEGATFLEAGPAETVGTP